jgi:hypothetical protein
VIDSEQSPWPKLFQNLRSTRETELAEDDPIHVVCAWVGNTQAVATKHYLQVTDEHFDRAAQADERAQKRAQHRIVRHRTASGWRRAKEKPGFTGHCRKLRLCKNLRKLPDKGTNKRRLCGYFGRCPKKRCGIRCSFPQFRP